MNFRYAILGVICIGLYGCGELGIGSKQDQSKMCIYSSDEEAKKCKSGELSYFKPNQWGNEQLPLTVAAVYCDFNYQVIYNTSGVVCTFTDKRKELFN